MQTDVSASRTCRRRAEGAAGTSLPLDEEEGKVGDVIRGHREAEAAEHPILGKRRRGRRVHVEAPQRKQLRFEHAEIDGDGAGHIEQHEKPSDEHRHHRTRRVAREVGHNRHVEEDDEHRRRAILARLELVPRGAPALGDHQQADDDDGLLDDGCDRRQRAQHALERGARRAEGVARRREQRVQQHERRHDRQQAVQVVAMPAVADEERVRPHTEEEEPEGREREVDVAGAARRLAL